MSSVYIAKTDIGV